MITGTAGINVTGIEHESDNQEISRTYIYSTMIIKKLLGRNHIL